MSREVVVPLKAKEFNYFERQRTVYKESISSNSSLRGEGKSVDDELAIFDKELAKIKADLFQLKPMDFGGGMGQLEFNKDFDMDLINKDFGAAKSKALTKQMSTTSSAKMTTTVKKTTTSTVKSSSGTSTTSSSTQSSSVEETSGAGGLGALESLDTKSLMAGLSDAGSDMLKVDHPIVTDATGEKHLALRFDVSKFKPENISVRTLDNCLMVSAEQREETANRKIYRKFSSQYILPGKIDAEKLSSILSADGVLDISAPTPLAVEAPKERFLSIMHL